MNNILNKYMLLIILSINVASFSFAEGFYLAEDSELDRIKIVEHILNLDSEYSSYPLNVQLGIIELLFNFDNDSEGISNKQLSTALNKRLDALGSSIDTNNNQKLRIATIEALVAFRNNDCDISAFTEWANIDIDNSVPLMMIANAYWQKGEIHQCLKYCEKATKCSKASLNELKVLENILAALDYLELKEKYLACCIVKRASFLYDAMIYQHTILLKELGIIQKHFGYNIESPNREARKYICRVMLSRPICWNVVFCAVYKNILKLTELKDLVLPPDSGVAANKQEDEVSFLESYYNYIVFSNVCVDTALNNKDIDSLESFIVNEEKWSIEQLDRNKILALERNIDVDLCCTNWNERFSELHKTEE